jgi:energy-coupling factor transporter ATP-binding protein EcfA2
MVETNSYNIFDALQKWSNTLDVWQRLALIKLIKKGALTDEDYSKIFEEFKIDKNLIDPPSDREQYHFDAESIPSKKEESSKILLKCIQNVKGVNSLTEEQSLTFGENLTVIYGPNGSGKSGYARILKTACFTRSLEKEILGNVHIPTSERPAPSARFIFGNEKIEDLELGKSCCELLDNFAVFDSSCVRVYTDSQNQFNVSPYGFDVFPGLVKTTEEMKSLLNSEILKRTPDIEKFKIPDSTSVVAELLNNLSEKTNLEELEKFSNFTEEEEKRSKDIAKQLEDLNKKDPEELIKQRNRYLTDIQTIIDKVSNIAQKLNDELILEIKEQISEAGKLDTIAKVNSIAQFGKEPVQPVGTDAWKKLVEAAIVYSEEAYPDEKYPPDSEDARCVLCHQFLKNENARDRLESFFKFIQSDTKTKLDEHISNLKNKKSELEEIDCDFFNKEASCHRSLEDIDTNLLNKIQLYVEKAKSRKIKIIKNIKNNKWENIDELTEDLTPEIELMKKRISKEIEDLGKKDVSEIKKNLNNEYQLLSDRRHLNKNYAEVKESIKNLSWIKKARYHAKSLNTKSITEKQKVLTKDLIAKGFIENFKKECKELQFNLPIDIKVQGVSGTTIRKLEISETGSSPDPSRVLSEGEQTAVALADFLTEINLDDRPLGIVFDDPVTSFDHVRKELIAKRLVEEAKKRQVIIFTHDIIFTNHLAKAAETEKVKFAGRTVSWSSDNQVPGYIGHAVFPHSYYEGKSARKSEELLNEAKTLSGKIQEEKLILGCGYLRTAYEDFIQRTVFNDVINRWREEMKPFALSGMYYDEELITQIGENMGQLSKYIEAHSHSPEYKEVPLTTDLLQKFIDQYYELTKKYKNEKNAFNDKKKKEKKALYE